MSGKQKTEGARRIWDKYKFAALAVLAGVVLLAWPDGEEEAESAWQETAETSAARLDLQEDLEEILGQIRGVGEGRVLLTLEADGERQLAEDSALSYSGSASAPEDYSRTSETVLLDSGGADAPVVTRRTYPTYRGALVVCGGADRAEVRLAVTEAVTALTGLTADSVTVAKSQ